LGAAAAAAPGLGSHSSSASTLKIFFSAHAVHRCTITELAKQRGHTVTFSSRQDERGAVFQTSRASRATVAGRSMG